MKKIIVAVVLAGAGILAATAWQRKEAPRAVAAKPVARTFVAAGRVEPASEEIRIGSELDGKLRSVLVEEGDTVRRGQVVATLENADYQARVELARAVIRQREAELDRLRNGARAEEKREAAALVREASSQMDTARAEWERRRTLLDRGAISRSELDLAARDYETAKARWEASGERRSVTDAQTRPEDLQRAEAELERAQAQLAEARAMFDKTLLRSSVDGTVLRKFRKAGESVSSNGSTPVVALGDCSRLRVRVDVDEADVAGLLLGQSATVRADAYGDRQFTGKVIRIGQALGRKNVRTDEPSERVDNKILETLVVLDEGQRLPIGLRVDAYLEKAQ